MNLEFLQARLAKKLLALVLVGIGFLLSPLSWWNDLFFNLPLAYGFGYLCSWVDADWLIPGAIAGYWLSNLLGILLMQFGVINVVQQETKPNMKKELFTGLVSSSIYTVVIVLLVQFKILNLSELWSSFASLLPG